MSGGRTLTLRSGGLRSPLLSRLLSAERRQSFRDSPLEVAVLQLVGGELAQTAQCRVERRSSEVIRVCVQPGGDHRSDCTCVKITHTHSHTVTRCSKTQHCAKPYLRVYSNRAVQPILDNLNRHRAWWQITNVLKASDCRVANDQLASVSKTLCVARLSTTALQL